MKKWVHVNKMGVELKGKLIHTCPMTGMDFDGDGSDFYTLQSYNAILEKMKYLKEHDTIERYACNPSSFFNTLITMDSASSEEENEDTSSSEDSSQASEKRRQTLFVFNINRFLSRDHP